MMTREAMHAFWRNPNPDNRPAGYRDGLERSAELVRLMLVHVPKDARILELGCNVGRNLHALAKAGYTDLSGVEINDEARHLAFPEFALHVGSIEDFLPRVEDDEYDVIFTMAVLEHLHPSSEWVFARMQRIARTIVTVEDERGVSQRHVPRDYSQVFTGQVAELSCADWPGLGPDFMARVFVR